MKFRRIGAVLFDMDGTLVDSEGLTTDAVLALLANHGVENSSIDTTAFFGVTFPDIADQLLQRSLAGSDRQSLALELQRHFHQAFVASGPREIPGAIAALQTAARTVPTAIVTSSQRDTAEHMSRHFGVRDELTTIVCAEDITRGKPDPECYSLASRRLGVSPERCLVFEDSVAGLTAACRAGMRTVAVTAAAGHLARTTAKLADAHIRDYTELTPGFFASIVQP